MRLTTKGRFAVTAMLDLVLHHSKNPVPLSEISARQKISLLYLEQLFGKLRRAGLVDSVRGAGGGYAPVRDALQLTVADIVRSVETPEPAQCGCRKNCQDEERCMTHELWANLNVKMDEYMASVTLQDLVDKRLEKHDQKSITNNMRHLSLLRADNYA